MSSSSFPSSIYDSPSTTSTSTTNTTTTTINNNNNYTNNVALFLLFLIFFNIFFIHSIVGYCDAKQLMMITQRQSIESSTNQPAGSSSSSMPTPKPEHKTYPDQNILVGRIAHLPCHLPGHQSSDDKEPLQESEEDIRLDTSKQLFPSLSSSSSSFGVQSSQPLDMIQLILWYHGDDISGSPFYSVDARQQQSSNQNFYLNESASNSASASPSITSQWKHFLMDPYNERAKFVVYHHHHYHQYKNTDTNTNFHQALPTTSNNLSNQPFMLIIDPVMETDQGLYWCRVDYRWTRTTISKVRLNVYVPPKILTIYQLEPSSSTTKFWSEFIKLNINKSNNNDSSRRSLDQFKNDLYHILALKNKNASNGTSDQQYWFPLRPIEIKTPNVMDSNGNDAAATVSFNHQFYHQQYYLQKNFPTAIANVDEMIDTVYMCESIGGNPPPTIHWYWNDRKLEPSKDDIIHWKNSTLKPQLTTITTIISTKSRFFSDPNYMSRFHVINVGLVDDLIYSRLVLYPIIRNDSTVIKSVLSRVLSFLWIRMPERSDQDSIVRCQSTNSPQVPLSKSLNKIFKIDVNLNPVKAQIVDARRDGSTSGSIVHATCLTWGSRPPAKIYWFLNDRPLLDAKEIIFESNMTTKSQVRFILQSIDNDRPLTCLAMRTKPEQGKRGSFSKKPQEKDETMIMEEESSLEKMIIKEILENYNRRRKFRRKFSISKNDYNDEEMKESVKNIIKNKIGYQNQTIINNHLSIDNNNNNNNSENDFIDNDSHYIPYDDGNVKKNPSNSSTASSPSLTLSTTSSYFVYDQITLTVEYLPNITIDLLENGLFNIDNTTNKNDYLITKNETMTNNPTGDEHQQQDNNKMKMNHNRNRKIFVKDRMKLRCLVDSNPPPYKIRWLLNHRDISLLFPSNEYHLTDKNRTLSIDGPRMIGLGRQHEGKYQCSAYNQLGRGDSNELIISVLRAPKCAFKSSSSNKKNPTTTTVANTLSTQVTKIDSTINYPANLFCQVDATSPSLSSKSIPSLTSSTIIDDRLWIYWQLPNSRHVLTLDHRGKLLQIPIARLDQFRKLRKNIQQDDHFYGYDDIEELDGKEVGEDLHDYRRITLASNDVRSRLTIIPQSSQDFGLYQCWAENAFGTNRYEPCMFNLTNSGHHQYHQKTSSNRHRTSPRTQRPLPRPVTNCTTTILSSPGLVSIRCQHKNHSSPSSIHQGSHLNGKSLSKSNQVDQELDRNLQFHLVLKELLWISHSDQEKREGILHNIKKDKKRAAIILANQTNPIEPVFLLSNLQPSSVYEAIMYVSNDFGISDQLRIMVKVKNDSVTSTSKDAEITSVLNQGTGMDAGIAEDINGDDFNEYFNSLEWSSSHSYNNVAIFRHSDDESSSDDDDDDDDHLRKPAIVVVGKPDLHKQQNSLTESSSGNKNKFFGSVVDVDGDTESLLNHHGQGGLATTVSLSSNINQHQSNNPHNNRFVLIIILVFIIVLITFSTLLSIAIGLCLYRRKRKKFLERHQRQLQEDQQQQQQLSNDINFDDEKPLGREKSLGDNKSKIIDSDSQLRDHPSSEYKSYLLDEYSTGVFILDTVVPHTTSTVSALNNKITNDFRSTSRPMMIYRDFVSTPPSSSTSSLQPTLITSSAGGGQSGSLAPTHLDLPVNQPPEFLYQPTTGVESKFLDLEVDNGNVHLIPSTPPPISSFLSYGEQQQPQTQSMFCLNTEEPIQRVVHQRQYGHQAATTVAMATASASAGLSISEV